MKLQGVIYRYRKHSFKLTWFDHSNDCNRHIYSHTIIHSNTQEWHKSERMTSTPACCIKLEFQWTLSMHLLSSIFSVIMLYINRLAFNSYMKVLLQPFHIYPLLEYWFKSKLIWKHKTIENYVVFHNVRCLNYVRALNAWHHTFLNDEGIIWDLHLLYLRLDI